ncbi:MAG: LysR family transcriptional regulator [Alphaproteobacteria bacterium]|nr:LysR family transcriptional regulator [Alphaproteobacteria bacterium]
MELYQIRYFLAVCETLNFTRAAEHCNVTQPALTRAIQRLEDELGGLLFRRERHLTHLTDLGHLVRPQLERVYSDTEAAKTAARGFLRCENAALNIGVMCTIGPARFIGFLARFRAANPGIEVSLREDGVERLLESLIEGTRDIVILASPEPLGERVRVEPLYRERFVVAFPAGHRFHSQDVVPVRDMNGEQYLSRINCEYYDYLRDLCRSNNARMHDAYLSEREDWIQSMVLAGMGVCFLPEFAQVVPGLLTRPLVEPDVVREISLATVAGRRFSPAVAGFVAAIRRHRWPEQEAVARS